MKNLTELCNACPSDTTALAFMNFIGMHCFSKETHDRIDHELSFIYDSLDEYDARATAFNLASFAEGSIRPLIYGYRQLALGNITPMIYSGFLEAALVSGAFSGKHGYERPSLKLITALFKVTDIDTLLAEDEDREFYERLPEHIIVYRGSYQVSQSIARRGLFWTLEPGAAMFYSNQGRFHERNRICLQGLVKKSDLLGAYDQDSEIIIPGRLVQNVTTIPINLHLAKAWYEEVAEQYIEDDVCPEKRTHAVLEALNIPSNEIECWLQAA